MGLDGVTNTATGFNPIRCNGPLDEVFGPAFGLLVLKNTDEEFPDDLPLFLGVCDAFEGLKVAICCFDSNEVDALFLKQAFDFFSLVLSHEAGVDINTVEQVANGLVGDNGCYSGIHTTRTGDDGHVVNGGFEGFNALRYEFLSIKHAQAPPLTSRSCDFTRSIWSSLFCSRAAP